jgi:hypothetical protein
MGPSGEKEEELKDKGHKREQLGSQRSEAVHPRS